MQTQTLAQMAETAVQIQDAANLSGVTLSLANEVLPALRQLMPTLSTRELARHPIVKMWVFKLYTLSWFEPVDERTSREYHDAYEWCKDMIKQGK